jgi:hypothetical protein
MDVSGTLTNTGDTFAVFDNRFGAELKTTSLGIINNLAGGIIDNAGTLNNNLGSVTNSAIINNKVGTGIINNNVGIFKINSGGTLNNEASSNINNDIQGTVDNSGTVVNIGNVNNSGVLENENIFNNTSTGIIDNTNTIANKVGGNLNNEGTLDNHDKFDNDGTVNNKEDATITNFAGGKITNNLVFQNDGMITNSDTITNTGTFTNDNYVENEKQIDNTSGTISNTCLINSSGNVPNTGGMINNQNVITNNGAMVFQPGGKFTNSGTLNGNLEANILENEIVPEEDKIKGRIIVSTPDRHAKPADKVGQLPLKGVKMTFTHSGGPILQDSDRTNGDFSFDVPTKKDTVSLETSLKDGASAGFPNGLIEVHNAAVGMPVKFKTENFNSCIRIAFLELNATNPELRISGEASTPTLTGLPQVSRLADLAGLYYYSFIGFDFARDGLTNVTLDASLPLELVGFSTSANALGASNFDPNAVTIHIQANDPYGTNKVGSLFANGTATEYQIDVLYHEFGHYIMYESRIGGENDGVNVNQNIHPNVTALYGATAGCHGGYAELSSSCAWSEGFASFISSVISANYLTDSKHSKFNSNVYNFFGGGVNLNQPWDVFGQVQSGMPVYYAVEEWSYAGLLWKQPGMPAGVDGLITKLTTTGNNPGNSEIVTTVADLYTVLKNSGSDTGILNATFATYKICDDIDNNMVCNVGDTFGVTAWKNINATKAPSSALFSYPQPPGGNPRTEGPPYLPAMVTFNVEDLTGTAIMDGTEVIIETVLSDGQKFTYTDTVYDGKIINSFNLPEGSHVNLLFSNGDYFSESVTMNHEEYLGGFGADDQLNSMEFVVAMTPKDPCTPPFSGDWIVSTSCELTADATITGNVTITNDSLVEIPSGITLTISSGNNITIEASSGLKIISGGTLQVNS